MKNIFSDGFIKNKYFLGFSLLILGIFIFFFPALPAKAMDETAPQITNVTIDKDVAEPGDIVKVTYDIVEEETGIPHLVGYFYFSKTNQKGNVSFSYDTRLAMNYETGVFDTQPNLYTGTYTQEIEITEDTMPGVYTYCKVYCYDGNYNESSYELEGIQLTIINPDYNNNALKLLDFSILNDSVNTADSISVDMTFEGQDIDLSGCKNYSVLSFWYSTSVYYYNHGDLTSRVDENGNTVIHGEFLPSDDMELKSPTYNLYHIVIHINGYKSMSYYYDSASEDGGIYKEESTGDTCLSKGAESITFLDYVEDPALLDTEPPTIQDIEILNKKVNRPDYVRFSYEASDNCKLRCLNVEIYRKEDNKRVQCIYVSLGGKLTASGTGQAQITSGVTPGTYILYVKAVDQAMNYSEPYQVEFEVTDEYVEGYDVAFDIGINNSDLVEDFQNLEAGKAGVIRMECDFTDYIPKAAFEAIQGRDVYLIVWYDYYVWIFYGQDITNPKDVWVGLTVTLTTYHYYDPPCTPEEWNDTVDVLRLTFPDNGTLPGKMQLRFKSDYLYNMYNLTQAYYVYFEDPNNQTLTYMDNAHPEYVVSGDEHWCYFDIYHHSKYLVSGRELKKKQSSQSGTSSNSTQTSNGGTSSNSATVQLPDKVKKITSKKIGGKMYLSWGSSNNAVGYEVEWSTSKTFKSKVSRKRFTSASGKHYINIKKGKVYYVRIRSYSYYNNQKGLYLYAAYSPVKKIKR